MNYLSPAESLLQASNVARGLGSMGRTSATPGPNAFDSGLGSKVQANTQAYNNDVYDMQSKRQNISSALPQGQAAAVQGLRKERLISDNAENKAVMQREMLKGTMMDVLGSPATLAIGNMSLPELTKFRNDNAVGKAMAAGVNPDLVQNMLGA